MNGLLPQSLVGRVIALLLLALTIVQVINVTMFFKERRDEIRSTKVTNLVSRTASIIRLLDGTPADLHQGILQAITTTQMHFWFSEDSPITPARAVTDNYLSERRFAELANVRPGGIRIMLDQDRQHDHRTIEPMVKAKTGPQEQDVTQSLAIISIARPQGQWLNAVQLALDPSHGWAWTLMMSLSFMALTVVIVVILIRRITRPLALLTTAIDQLGRGEEVAPLPEHGPQDMRRSISAFNQMRERLLRFVGDRTRMLAAISHDLRTPLTSLRLQAEFIDDRHMQEKMVETIKEMQYITTATLDFSRDDVTKEPTRLVDITALIDSLCQDLSDLGHPVSFTGGPRTPYRCRPSALTRSIRNLVENAVSYGDCAKVSLGHTDEQFIIIIDDQGEGISSDDVARVFEPFVRLEGSRNQETGGIGLGLSISRSLIHAHGGEIKLENRQPCGLRVTVSLPQQQES